MSADAVTPRETFATILGAQPIATGDAVILLTGDGLNRAPTARELIQRGFAPRVLISGGIDGPPYALDALTLRRALIQDGIDPLSIDTDMASWNTGESAECVAEWAVTHQWRRVLLVTSAYHMPRAYLTMVRALYDAALDSTVHVVPVRVCEPWHVPVEGLTGTRRDMIAHEAEKVEAYRGFGDVASYAMGLDYLRYWEEHAA